MRTDKEIADEIAKLREMKPKVRRATAFGDDNHMAIEAQIRALVDRMDEDDMWEEWPEDDEDCRERDCAHDAIDWMNGDSDDVPSEGWAELVVA